MLMCSLFLVPVLLLFLNVEWECSWMGWSGWSESDEGMEIGSKKDVMMEAMTKEIKKEQFWTKKWTRPYFFGRQNNKMAALTKRPRINEMMKEGSGRRPHYYYS